MLPSECIRGVDERLAAGTPHPSIHTQEQAQSAFDNIAGGFSPVTMSELGTGISRIGVKSRAEVAALADKINARV
jgi:hypothetical protein